jgi:FkbH-like protein
MNGTRLNQSPEQESTKVNVAISATFVAEPIEVSLSAWMLELGIDATIEFAPFNQVFQQLLSSLSLLSTNPAGIKVILLRFSDWQRGSGQSEAKLGGSIDLNWDITAHTDEFVTALSAAIQRCPSTFLVFVCPEEPSKRENLRRGENLIELTDLEDILVMKTMALECVRVVTTRELASIYSVADCFDSSTDKMADIPYTPIFYTALGTMVARKVHKLLSPPHKVILLDCDGTLWDGICGEDGPQGIRIDSDRQALQEFIVNQSLQGMLVCLCSKNNESDVLAVFDDRKDMILKRDHIATWRINWRNKSDNIRSLSQELGLALDSFIFIDNDPVECAEVRARCPEVLTLLLPRNAKSIPLFLKHVWVFDQNRLSKEDQERTKLYREHFKREGLRRESPTLEDFLTNLNLEIDIAPLVENETTRVSELTFRTNQFNLTSTKRSVAQINKFRRVDKGECLTVRVKDRFGDYGLVGAVFYQTHGDTLLIDTFLLSCRALGRGVEHRLLACLGEMALQRRLSYIDLCYIPSSKNEPALDFLRERSGAAPQTFENQIVYRMAASEAAQTIYDPDTERSPIELEADVKTDPIGTSRPDSRHRATLLSSIPETLCDPVLIHRWATQSHPRNVSDREFVKPGTPAEVCIAGFFSELLGIDQVGVNDGFFHLGGHSLLAMQLLSRVNAAFGVVIEPITLFTTNITVAELVNAVLADQLRQLNPQDVDTIIDSLSAITDEDSE